MEELVVCRRGVKWHVIREAGFIFETVGEDLSVLCSISFVVLM